MLKRLYLLRIVILTLVISQTLVVTGETPEPAWVKQTGARQSPSSKKIFPVNKYGAKADGQTVNTKFIQAAIDACAKAGGGIVTFAPGSYVTGSLFIKGNVELRIDEKVTILGSQNFDDYPEIKTRIAGIEMQWPAALINVMDQRNVAITGKGTINARGKFCWDKYWSMRREYEPKGLRWIVDYDAKRVRTILVQNASDVTLKDFTIKNSGFWTVQLLYSSYLTVNGLVIRNNEDGKGPSSDGVDVDSSSWVLIENCDIDCNDDDFCLKAGRDWDGLRVNKPTEYVVIRNCIARKGGGLLTLGSETSGGIRHVYATDLQGKGTGNGLHIKSATTRGGTIEDIHFLRIQLDSVGTAFQFTMNWNPSYSYSTLPAGYTFDSLPAHWKVMLTKVEPAEKGIPHFKDVHVSDIHGVGVKKVINAAGLKESLIEDFHFNNVQIQGNDPGSITHVKGWVYSNVSGMPDAENKATIQIDYSKSIAPMQPIWAWFGYDEPNYTYMKDGKKLLSELAALSPVPVHVRAHNLLTSGDGKAALKWGSTNVYTENAKGKPIYNWRIVDSIFDTYIQRGMKPLAEIGFMPEALSSHPQPYKHEWQPGKQYANIFTGWAYPPNDYKKWAKLVYEWVKHCVKRYGEKEVASWYWELWNEPNIGYWKGTVQEYCKLYDYTADAVKRALPSARMGGPHSTGPSWDKAEAFLRTFLTHCLRDTNYATGRIGAPLDFIAFHAKGAPRVVEGHVRMGISNQLRDISKGFETVASFPELKHLPIVIGESDPEGCAACGMATNPENAYRNGTMYSSYTAASFARKYLLADFFKVNFLGAVSWSFEFEDQPWFYGFRDLATNGVDKPVLNVFRMFGMMRGDRVPVESDRMMPLFNIRDSGVRKTNTDVGAIAAKDTRSATVMIWNYHDDDVQGEPATIDLQCKGIPGSQVNITQYRIDKDHSNSYEVWKKMGSPQQPTAEQIAQLEKAGQLQQTGSSTGSVKNGLLQLNLQLPQQGIVFLKLDW